MHQDLWREWSGQDLPPGAVGRLPGWLAAAGVGEVQGAMPSYHSAPASQGRTAHPGLGIQLPANYQQLQVCCLLAHHMLNACICGMTALEVV